MPFHYFNDVFLWILKCSWAINTMSCLCPFVLELKFVKQSKEWSYILTKWIICICLIMFQLHLFSLTNTPAEIRQKIENSHISVCGWSEPFPSQANDVQPGRQLVKKPGMTWQEKKQTNHHHHHHHPQQSKWSSLLQDQNGGIKNNPVQLSVKLYYI